MILRRLLQAIPLILGVLTLLFVLLQAMPGDPSDYYFDPNLPEETSQRVRENLGLDRPVVVQYLLWLKNALLLDFQVSFHTQRPVIEMIGEALPRTLLLAGVSILLMFGMGMAAGIYAAVKRDTWVDRILMGGTLFFYSMPVFLLAMLLMLLFSTFPASGSGSWQTGNLGFWGQIADGLHHLFLPALTLSLANAAIISRYMRTAMVESLGQDFILTARAKGLAEGGVLFRHALRGALLPMITLGGLTLPFFFSGAVIVEYVFGWYGMGTLIVNSIMSRDYPVVLAATYFITLFVVFGNLLADIGYRIADPRIHQEGP